MSPEWVRVLCELIFCLVILMLAVAMIENSAVATILTEMELRLAPKDTKLVIPRVCTA